MTYQLIVPTKIETALSGFVGAIEKNHRGRLFRVEFHAQWAGGTACKKDGKSIDWEKLPHVIRKDAHAGCAILMQGHSTKTES